jgi:hypothetical protein
VATRGTASLVNLLIREKLLARRLEGHVLATRLDHLRSSKNITDLDQIDKKTRDIGMLLGLKQASQLAIGFSPYFDFVRYLTGIFDAITGRPQVDSLVSYANKIEELLTQIEKSDGVLASALHSVSSRIDTDQAILGLGRMAAYVTGFAPDAIFTLNEGGAVPLAHSSRNT